MDLVDQELAAALDEIAAARPKGLIIRSAKDSFIAGADVEEFTRFKSPAEALSFVRMGWDVFQKLKDLPFAQSAALHAETGRLRARRDPPAAPRCV